MQIAEAEVRRRFKEGQDLPESDFDLLFFLEGMNAFFSRTDMIRRILSGEDLAAECDFSGDGK